MSRANRPITVPNCRLVLKLDHAQMPRLASTVLHLPTDTPCTAIALDRQSPQSPHSAQRSQIGLPAMAQSRHSLLLLHCTDPLHTHRFTARLPNRGFPAAQDSLSLSPQYNPPPAIPLSIFLSQLCSPTPQPWLSTRTLRPSSSTPGKSYQELPEMWALTFPFAARRPSTRPSRAPSPSMPRRRTSSTTRPTPPVSSVSRSSETSTRVS